MKKKLIILVLSLTLVLTACNYGDKKETKEETTKETTKETKEEKVSQKKVKFNFVEDEKNNDVKAKYKISVVNTDTKKITNVENFGKELDLEKGNYALYVSTKEDNSDNKEILKFSVDDLNKDEKVVKVLESNIISILDLESKDLTEEDKEYLNSFINDIETLATGTAGSSYKASSRLYTVLNNGAVLEKKKEASKEFVKEYFKKNPKKMKFKFSLSSFLGNAKDYKKDKEAYTSMNEGNGTKLNPVISIDTVIEFLELINDSI